MPKPLYIVCSLSGAEDRTLGLISIFHVLEQITIFRQSSAPPEAGGPMRITAAWIRDDDEDPSKEYEYQIVMREPPNGNELLLKDGKFTFGKALYRFVLD